MGIQTITTPTGEEMVVMPRADYEALVAAAEDAFEDGADSAAFAAALADTRPEDVLPSDVSAAILRGTGRLRAFREWRGVSIEELAASTGILASELNEIETGQQLLSREVAARASESLSLPHTWLTA